MSFISRGLSDIGHAFGGIVKGLGPIGTAAALGAGLYFGAPYLSSLAAGAGTGAGAATAAAAPDLWGAAASGTLTPTVAFGAAPAGLAGEIAPYLSGASTLSNLAAGGGMTGEGGISGIPGGTATAAIPGVTTAADLTGAGGIAGIPTSAGGLGLSPETWTLSNLAHSVGSMPLGSALSYGSGAYGLLQADQMKKLAAQYAAAANPTAPYAAGYASQLNNLMANPNQIASMPGYQAGLQAVERSQAAGGYLGSGNMMKALADYGGNFYQQQFNNLAALAGVGGAPAAGQIGMAGLNAASNLTSSALGSIGYGATLPQLTALLSKMSGG